MSMRQVIRVAGKPNQGQARHSNGVVTLYYGGGVERTDSYNRSLLVSLIEGHVVDLETVHRPIDCRTASVCTRRSKCLQPTFRTLCAKATSAAIVSTMCEQVTSRRRFPQLSFSQILLIAAGSGEVVTRTLTPVRIRSFLTLPAMTPYLRIEKWCRPSKSAGRAWR